jgi:hypothetical protein
MAKTKAQLLDEAKAAELVPADADPDGYTAENLTALLHPENQAAWEGSLSARTPQVAPDGHVNLSQSDIDAQSA